MLLRQCARTGPGWNQSLRIGPISALFWHVYKVVWRVSAQPLVRYNGFKIPVDKDMRRVLGWPHIPQSDTIYISEISIKISYTSSLNPNDPIQLVNHTINFSGRMWNFTTTAGYKKCLEQGNINEIAKFHEKCHVEINRRNSCLKFEYGILESRLIFNTS